jgi:hypothetical protein
VFITVPLPVKDMRGLQDALLAWTRGEELNPARQCKECGATSALRHEETLLDLPPVLAFQLQRFEASAESWSGTVRTRGRFAFPETVDLYPYTTEGKARRERDPSGVVVEGEDGDEGVDDGEEEEEEEAPPREWYRLQGVLMHRGASPQEGHYYSYVRRGKGEGAWWCLNDESVAPFDVAREAERAWFQGGMDSPFILVYARDGGDEEAEAEAEAAAGGLGGMDLAYSSSSSSGKSAETVLLSHPAAPQRLEGLAALVAGLTESTLGGHDSHRHHQHQQQHPPPLPATDVQRLLELFYWLGASAARAAAASIPPLVGGSDEGLHALRSAGGLLRRRLLEAAVTGGGGDRERDALAVWVLGRLADGWLAGVFAAADADGGVAEGKSAHAAPPLLRALRRLWVGVAEAALDRAASAGGEKAEAAMDALAGALAAPALRAWWEGEGVGEGGLAAVVARVRPRMEGMMGKGGGDGEFEDAVEDLDEEEGGPGAFGGGEGGGGGVGGAADAG